MRKIIAEVRKNFENETVVQKTKPKKFRKQQKLTKKNQNVPKRKQRKQKKQAKTEKGTINLKFASEIKTD